jgi:hypothetical protein
MSDNISTNQIRSLFYKPQKEAGNKIILHYKRGSRYCMNIAKVQAGKSGTYHYTAIHMLRFKLVKHIIIMCGMNDNELKRQTEKNYKKYLSEYRKYVSNFTDDMVQILFQKDIEKAVQDKTIIQSKYHNFNNTLIIIDESDRTQDCNNKKFDLLSHCGLRLDGNPDILNRKKTYILSVSATPFSEYSDNIHGTSFKKEIVFLKTDSVYYGIKDFYENGKIQDTFSLNDEPGKKTFVEIIKHHGNKYNLIRVSQDKDAKNGSNEYKNILNICASNNIKIREFNGTSNDTNINHIIKKLPDEPIIILIKNSLRAGKVIKHKQNIGFVWENSKHPDTDTIIQGLLGRMCGYDANKDVAIYVPSCILEEKLYDGYKLNEIERYIEFHNNKQIIPRCANNLKKDETTGKELNTLNKYSTTPICIDGMINSTDKNGIDMDALKKTILSKIDDDYINIIDINQRDEVKNIIDHYINGNRYIGDIRISTSIRHYSGTQYTSANNPGGLLDEFHKAYINKVPYSGNLGISNNGKYTDILFGLVYKEYEFIGESKEGSAYIVFRTSSEPKDIDNIRLNMRIPKTNNEIFHKAISEGNAVIVQVFTIPVQYNPDALEKQLDEVITKRKLDRYVISSNSIDCKNVKLSDKYFRNNKLTSIITKLQNAHNVDIKLELNNETKVLSFIHIN